MGWWVGPGSNSGLYLPEPPQLVLQLKPGQRSDLGCVCVGGDVTSPLSFLICKSWSPLALPTSSSRSVGGASMGQRRSPWLGLGHCSPGAWPRHPGPPGSVWIIAALPSACHKGGTVAAQGVGAGASAVALLCGLGQRSQPLCAPAS